MSVWHSRITEDYRSHKHTGLIENEAEVLAESESRSAYEDNAKHHIYWVISFPLIMNERKIICLMLIAKHNKNIGYI
jgi:hypothetical protein